MQRGARVEVDFHGKKLGGMFVGFVSDGAISTVLMDEDTQTINVNTDSVVFMTKPGPRSHMRRVVYRTDRPIRGANEEMRMIGYYSGLGIYDGESVAIIESSKGNLHHIPLDCMRFDDLQPAPPPRKP